ncbi:AMP-binding protein [uncultured Alsobacter sp.]|uniref:AMP-binding protein n=1 Tax=uncultured Alsobacter sp. TaxID=1748258 RepID=UPI0025E4F596|nr:AMP-binding protein [uncultured Alsobacter sp.]
METQAQPQPSAAVDRAPAWPFGSVSDRQARLRDLYPAWTSHTLDRVLDDIAAAHPDRPLVVTDDLDWSYAEVKRRSERIAAGLVAAGVKPGDHVALLMANHPDFVAIKFGIARAGAVAVPINFLNRRDELSYVLAQSDAVFLFTMDRFRDLDYLGFLDELAPGWEGRAGGSRFPRLKAIVVRPDAGIAPRGGLTTLADFQEQAPAWTPIAHPGPTTNSDIIYTSGTTGAPKGVMLTHDMLARTAFGSTYGRAFEDGRRILFSLPMYHVYGYVEGLLACLFVGGSIVPQLKFDAAMTLRGIERHRATDVLLIPTMTMALLDEVAKAPYDLSSLHAMISSGGRSPSWIWQRIFDDLGPHELTTGYGMTEVTASATVTRPDDPFKRLLHTNGRLRDVGPAGDLASGGLLVSYRVVEPLSGEVLQPGEVGELQARGIGVTAGYYNKPDETAAAFTADGWLRTGDLGRVDEEGYLTLVGRLKESYRCGGEQVLPSEIEDLLVTHPAVFQAHVVPVADERMGEIGVACIVLRNDAAVTAQELIAFCAAHLARFKVPRHVVFLRGDEIPVTPSGRARKFLLADIVRERLNLGKAS